MLILGRFSEERKPVLDAIREELRKHDYLPILFDFQPSPNQPPLGTIKTLASMARFVIVDYWKYDWVLPPHRYEGLQLLLATLAEKVIAPAEAKVKALEERRRAIEVALTAPRTSA